MGLNFMNPRRHRRGRLRRSSAAMRHLTGRSYTRNPGFAGLRAGIRATLVKPRRRRAKSRRRLPGRNALGHFIKRRAKPRRAVRRAPVRRRYHRATAGRFTSRYSPKYVRRQRRRPTKSRKHYRARVMIRPRQRIAGLVVRNPYTGEMMPMATVVNPRRRRRRTRRNPGLVAVNRRRSKRRRTRRNPGLVAVNRRRRRHARNPRRRHHARRMRRNPGMAGGFMSSLKGALPMAAGGVAGGALAGFIDTKLLTGRPTLSILAKLGLAVIGGMALRRRFPGLANGLVGGAVGSIGYSVGVKMGGGMVAHNAAGAIKGLGDMAGEDQALTNLLSGTGFGVLLEGLGDGSVQEYLSGGGGSTSDGDSGNSAAGLGVLLQ
jgi:hypothetical protein